MLFVWLFALTSGLVNACALEPHGVHDHGAPHSHRAPGESTLGAIGHHADGVAPHTHETDSQPAKESCWKSCDDSSQTLQKHASSFDLVDPGLAPFAAAAWAVEAKSAPALGQRHDFFRLPEHGPPVRVLFSRLAL
jgi:hypothetical protein